MPESGIVKLFSSLPHLTYTSYQPPVTWQWEKYTDQLPWPGKKHIEHLKKPIEGLKYAETLELDASDNSVDGVVCCHALPLIQDNKQALKEMLRVLKPGGWALCMIPLDYSRETTYEDFSLLTDDERLEKFGQPDKLRKYGRDFPQLLRKAGFQVKIAYLKDVPQNTREYYGIDCYDADPAANEMRGADIFFCTKPH